MLRYPIRCPVGHPGKSVVNTIRSTRPNQKMGIETPSKATVIEPHNGRPVAQSAWAKSIEKVNNKQAELKQREAATTEWGSVVEKLSVRLKQQAVAARTEALARTVEKLRSLHTGLPVRMADSDFDRVWYGHCPVKAGLKPVALGPEPLKDDGAA